MSYIRIQQAPIDNAIVGKPVAHFSSQMQATGEATYANDTSQYKGKHTNTYSIFHLLISLKAKREFFWVILSYHHDVVTY